MAKRELPMPALTGLRFFPALLVIAYHFWPSSSIVYLDNFKRAGAAGVMLFCILSGFILTFNYAPRANQLRSVEFYKARLARIYPSFLLALVLSTPPFIKAYIYNLHHTWAEFCQTTVLHLLLLHGWSYNTAYMWNAPSWFLSVDAFFYLTFPFVLLWLARKSLTWVKATLVLSAICALAPTMFVLLRGHVASMGGPLFWYPQFIAGMCLALIFLEQPPKSDPIRSDLLAILSFLMIAPVMCLWPRLAESVLVVPLCLMVWALADGSGRIGKFLSLPLLLLLGETSYAMYIFHEPLYQIIARVEVKVGLTPTTVPFTILYTVVCIVCCVGLMRYFETPLRKKFHPKVRRLDPTRVEPETVVALS